MYLTICVICDVRFLHIKTTVCIIAQRAELVFEVVLEFATSWQLKEHNDVCS